MALIKQLLNQLPTIRQSTLRRKCFTEVHNHIFREIENLVAQRRTLYTELNQLYVERQQSQHDFDNARAIKLFIVSIRKNLTSIEQQLMEKLNELPNVLSDDIPESNVVVKEWRPKTTTGGDNGDAASGLIDLNTASKVSGRNFCYLHDNVATLHRALANFMIDQHTNNGYQETYCPYIVQDHALFNSGQLPKFKDDLFYVTSQSTPHKNFILIPTGEVSLVNLLQNRILRLKDLPIKLVTHTPCFRPESASYGAKRKGIIRQYQFDKVEIVQFVQQSRQHETLTEMVDQVTNILELLEMPYHTLLLSADELSFSAHKSYDVEAWSPVLGQYVEVSSCSTCDIFQTSRLNCRLDNSTEQVASLNASGLAVGRMLKLFLEQHGNDNTIYIPKPLRRYLGGRDQIIVNKNSLFFKKKKQDNE